MGDSNTYRGLYRPFHKSFEEAQAGTQRKLNNLLTKKDAKIILNFGGQPTELWCEGGERKFICNMIRQSQLFASSCLWFSTLVAKEINLNSIYQQLKKVPAVEVKTILMKQGSKCSRIVAWTFFSKDQQQEWADARGC